MSLIAAQLSPEYRFTPAPRFPRYATSLLNRICDRYWETALDIRTLGSAPSPHADSNRYGYLAYHTYFSIFKRLALGPTDVVVDLGCGKGRVSCVAAQFAIRKSIGVEIDPPLCDTARTNGSRLRRHRAPLHFVCQSATDFDYDEASVIVMFHPFGADTMREVLARWQESLTRRPRLLRVAYSNPLLSPMLAATSFLQLYECWNPGTWSRVKFPVHFYRSTRPGPAAATTTS
jgi:SAM-dependent methyltransferase